MSKKDTAEQNTRRTGNKRGHNRGILAQRREDRRLDAVDRAEDRAQRSTAEQLDRLVKRPGNSAREMSRLQKRPA